MNALNLKEAFGSYSVKPPPGARSAITPLGALVVCCRYEGFHGGNPDVMRYEEDLSTATGKSAAALRAHLSEAITQESDVQMVVAIALAARPPAKAAYGEAERPTRTSYHARKDMVGRVKSFDGDRFVIEFRRADPSAGAKPAPRRGAKRPA